MAKKKSGKKVRVDFRKNRSARRRSDDWTQRFHADDAKLQDAAAVESIRPKGELSRKRTVIENQASTDEATWCAGTVTIVHGLYCYVDDDAGQNWECTIRRVLRTRSIDTRSPVSVGDRVWFSDHSKSDVERVGVIERVAPRRSELSRKDRRGCGHTIVANADQLLIVASVAQPALKPHLVDRYIVAALAGGLRPLICFNKIDLAPSGALHREDLEELASEHAAAVWRSMTLSGVIDEFRSLGFACLETSAAEGRGIAALRTALAGHTTVLAGQSGVGKSSLLNAVQPGLALAVSAVSTDTEKGRHTTTHARLIRLHTGGYVVDTPGVRAFELWNVAPGALEAHFVEFAPRIARCRFKDCLHRDEAGCAVRAAAESSEISARRYWSYRKMLEDSRAM